MAGKIEAQPRIDLTEFKESKAFSPAEIDIQAINIANQEWRKRLRLREDPIRVTVSANGQFTLRAQGVTGAIRVGNVDIAIAPKFVDATDSAWPIVLWRVLATVDGIFFEDQITSAGASTALPIQDLLAEIFLSSFQKGVARGLPRQYRNSPAKGTQLRGHFDNAKIGFWLAKPWEIPYVTDKLTEDTQLARLLRWTAATLTRSVIAPNRARALNEVANSLSHVNWVPPHLVDARRIHLGLQNQALEHALMVGVMLLEGLGVQHSEGAFALPGFLWRSDLVYEKFIYWLSQNAATRLGLRVTKNKIIFGKVLNGAGSQLETIPDVVFLDAAGSPVGVLDAKYKLFGLKPKPEDTYQVLTAAHTTGCPRVALCYPVNADEDPVVWAVPSNLGARGVFMTALPLNLMLLKNADGISGLIGVVENWLLQVHELLAQS